RIREEHGRPPAAGGAPAAPALLDKDTMYGTFVAATLTAAGRPAGEREGPWYDEHIKVHEYAGMTATARQIRSHGCPVLLSAPFTEKIRGAGGGGSGAAGRGGKPGGWIGAGRAAAPLHRRLTTRGSGRDTAKLADFKAFAASMRLAAEPAAPHHTIDNRLEAGARLETQVTALARSPCQDTGVPPACRPGPHGPRPGRG